MLRDEPRSVDNL